MAETVTEEAPVLNGPELVDTVFERDPEEVGLVELWPDEVVVINVTDTLDETVGLGCCCLSVV